MTNQFSKKVSDILMQSKQEAQRTDSKDVKPEHLLLGIMKSGTQTEAILVARCRVADNLEVAVVAVGVVAVVDVAVAVKVNKLDVARRADELVVVLEGHLINRIRGVLHMCGAGGSLVDDGCFLDLAVLVVNEVALLVQTVGNSPSHRHIRPARGLFAALMLE